MHLRLTPLFVASILFSFVATIAKAAEDSNPDLRWCIPFTDKFAPIAAEPQEFLGEEELKQKYEEPIRDITNREADKPTSILALLPTILEESFPRFSFYFNPDVGAATCQSSDEWVIGMSVPRETVLDVTLCVQTANAVNLAPNSSSELMDRCAPGAAGITVSDPVTLAALVDRGDELFNQALGADQRKLDEAGTKIKYRIMYHASDVSQTAKRLAVSEAEARRALVEGLEERATMVLSQFIRIGLAPKFRIEVGKSDGNSDGRPASVGVTPLYSQIYPEITIPSPKALYFDPGQLYIFANVGAVSLGARLCETCNQDEVKTAFQRQTSEKYLKARDRDDALISADHPAPSRRDIDADARLLNSDPDLTAEVFDYDAPTVPFRIQRVNRTPNGKVTLGAGYSGSEGWSVPLSLDWAIPGTDSLYLSLNLTAKEFGWEADGRFSYTLPNWSTRDGPGGRLDIEIRAVAGKDSDRLFGNTNGQTVTENVETVEFGIFHDFSSLPYRERQRLQNIYSPTNRSIRYWSSTLRAGVGYRDVALKGDPATLAGLDQGRYFAAYLKGDLHRDLYLPFVLRSSTKRRPSWTTRYDTQVGFSGDLDDPFLRLLFRTELRGTFGSKGTSSGFFRFGAMGGWVSDNAPTYAFLDAADPLFLKGLRQQEFMARKLVGLTGEVGLDVTRLLTLSKKTKEEPNGQLSSPRYPEDLVTRSAIKEILVSVFAETGWLQDRLQDGTIHSGTERIDSFGLALTMRQVPTGGTPLEVGLGYAYSPQSIYETNGVFFVALNKTF